MAKLIIIRGLPGSGKTTLAKDYLNTFNDLLEKVGHPTTHIEADMYFEDAKGNYKYDASKIKEAHEWCQEQTKKYLGNGIDVIVSNTFTRKWELDPYLKMVNPEDIMIMKTTGSFGNVHGVSDEVIEKMKERWEDIPGEYIISGEEVAA
jgi:adenylate kinase family enzyme